MPNTTPSSLTDSNLWQPQVVDHTFSLEQIVRRARGLYSLPAVAMQVLELTSTETVDTQALKECVENDPALTARLLRVVNSSLFGLSSQVSDLNQALALLGTKPLKLLVLGFSLPDRLLSGIARDRLACYWRDSLTRAVAGRVLSETIWRMPGDEAFIAGLLADIGLLVLIQDLGSPYADFLDHVELSGDDLLACEREWLGFDHTALSARLLAHWGLPKDLVAAVAVPRSTNTWRQLSVSPGPQPKILYLADQLVALVARRRIGVLPDLLEAGETICGMTRTDLVEIVKSLQANVEQLADVLSLELPAGLEYCDILARAHAQLADAVTEAVSDQLGAAVDRRHTGPRRFRDHGPRDASGQPTAAERPPPVQACPNTAAPAPAVPCKPDAADNGSQEEATMLLGRLTAMVTCCRTDRRELSLLLVEIDNYDQLVHSGGVAVARRFAARLDASLSTSDLGDAVMLPMTAARFALLLPGSDRTAAVALGRQLIAATVAFSADQSPHDRAVPKLSIGLATVAVPPKNFSARALIDSAQRCLHAARSSRKNALKSIEVY